MSTEIVRELVNGEWTTTVGAGGCYQNGCCWSLSRVKLSGYPVTEIVEVTIGGDIIPAEDRWPACQNLAVGDDEPGAFAVT